MKHYQRATLKIGEGYLSGAFNVDAEFDLNGADYPSTGVSFRVIIGKCISGNGCGIIQPSSQSLASERETSDINLSNPTQSQKEQFGIVSVSNGKVQDRKVNTTPKVNKRVSEISDSVEGREVTQVALRPPALIQSQSVNETTD